LLSFFALTNRSFHPFSGFGCQDAQKFTPFPTDLRNFAIWSMARLAIVERDGNLRCFSGSSPARATFFLTRPWLPRAALLRHGHLFRERNNPMPTGTVKFFNADKGYGFIAPDGGGNDSFVHISAVQAAGMMTLDKDQRLNYEVEDGKNGKQSAVNLSAAD
jgi:cold shock protein